MYVCVCVCVCVCEREREREREREGERVLRGFFFIRLYCPIGIFSMGNLGSFPQGQPASDSRATQPMVHALCFNVSIIHRTMTWTTGSLTRACVCVGWRGGGEGGCARARVRVLFWVCQDRLCVCVCVCVRACMCV